MKSISIITLLALVAMLATPKAEAKDNTGAIVGGIVGGIIIGSILSDDDSCATTSVSVGYDTRYGAYGHWEWTTVRTWVPGYHEVRYDRCGNRYRSWVPGYYTHTRQRVWVADRYAGSRYRHDDHRDRHYGRHDDDRRDNDRDDRRGERIRDSRVTHRF